jgi:hypothetical protein
MLTITTAAAAMIRDHLQRSDVPNPVVCLGQVSTTPAEVTEALKRGAKKKELQEIASRALESETKYLYPLIYPRSHFLWVFTTTIQGFPFASLFFHPASARQAMKRGLLDVAARGLVLKDADGTVVLPKPAAGAL